jgi:hypothetical protein
MSPNKRIEMVILFQLLISARTFVLILKGIVLRVFFVLIVVFDVSILPWITFMCLIHRLICCKRETGFDGC